MFHVSTGTYAIIFTDHPPRYLKAARTQLVIFDLQRFVKKAVNMVLGN